jgi:hypothetical protein
MTRPLASLAGGLLSVTTAVLVFSCGARSSLPVIDGPEGSGGSGGEAPIAPDCAVFDSATNLAPLDMFITLDASGSMDQDTAGGASKWDAVRSALGDFTSDQESAGISVSLSFFPINKPGVPAQCKSSDDCGEPDTCDFFSVCPSTFDLCTSDQDCQNLGLPNDTCSELGQCTATPNVCFVTGQIGCAAGNGPCNPIGSCRNRTVCELDAYADPVVDLVDLPGGSGTLLNAIDVRSPDGSTPTLPALTGALDAAIARAQAEPEHKVIAVLATDGFPSACDPDLLDDPEQALANLVEVAADATALGVPTFVIGVFSPDQQAVAEANLGAIAAAGGTDQAFVVSTQQQVTQGFLEALNTVRLTTKSCQFAIEGDVDLDTVWLRLTPKQGLAEPIWVPQVDGPASCPNEGPAFYIEFDEGQPFAVLCPATCALLGASVDRRVEIYTTCPDPTQ